MAIEQLKTVLQVEQDKEDKLGIDLRQAQHHLIDNEQKLEGIQQYRLDYMKQLHYKAQQGIEGNFYNQYQAFMKKLDSASEQQINAVNTAKRVVEQRKELWLKQQQKRKALEMLIEKHELAKQERLDKAEQQMLDEIATNQFIRNQKR
ncbi:flagellar export protein FliJ [Flocculibacter collagenilyticus]|uniref:flagellar export protein FliJ n=1 Tax=Flocculibacter collagenilyticus TaxID=2744479 RepID=UPI0018F70F7F|nr:flagellar export protein FliJ [Flocculibacter collagenilyticus]